MTANLTVTASFELLPIQTISPTTSIIRADGHRVETFTIGSGVWTIPVGVTSVEVMVVGGGGSGKYNGGGGGGGGFYYATTYAVTPNSNVPITVGLPRQAVPPAAARAAIRCLMV